MRTQLPLVAVVVLFGSCTPDVDDENSLLQLEHSLFGFRFRTVPFDIRTVPPDNSEFVSIDFRLAAFPPLVKKTGWLSKLSELQPTTAMSTSSDPLRTMAVNAKREIPINWVLAELTGQHADAPAPIQIFRRSPKEKGVVDVDVPNWWKALRKASGSPFRRVMQFYQFAGCPETVFNQTSASANRGGHLYPMCAQEELDKFILAFVDLAERLQGDDGLTSAFSFWQEPAHTLQNKDIASCKEQFRQYLDFYQRVATALRGAKVDLVLAGWNLNAFNARPGQADRPDSSMYSEAVQQFLGEEARLKQLIPLDYFTIQDYRAEALGLDTDAVLPSSRHALGPAIAADRFDLTPVILSRLNPKHQRSVSEEPEDALRVLGFLRDIADAPDIAYVVLSKEDNVLSQAGSQERPLTMAVLERFHALPVFRVPVSVVQGSVDGVAARSADAKLQCALLWRADWRQPSAKTATLTVQLKLQLPDGPSSQSFLEMSKLDFKSHAFAVWQRKTLTGRSANLEIEFAPLSVVELCLTDVQAEAEPGGRNDQNNQHDGEDLTGVSYARHQVLVPRSANASESPAGFGHYDVFTSTLFAAANRQGDGDVERRQRGVGLAAVTLSNVTASAIQIQFNVWPPEAAPEVRVALRLDFLNGDAALQSRLWQTTAAGPNATSVDPFAEVRRWPRGASKLESTLLQPRLQLSESVASAFSPGPILKLAKGAPDGWSSADKGARRLRISLLARHRGSGRATGPFTVAAKLAPLPQAAAAGSIQMAGPVAGAGFKGRSPSNRTSPARLFLPDRMADACSYHVEREQQGRGPVVSGQAVTRCVSSYNGHVVFHLFDHPRFKVEQRSPVNSHRLPTATGSLSRKRRMAAVVFSDMGRGCPDHYGHFALNAVFSLFVHFVEKGPDTWFLLGYGAEPETADSRPKLYVPDLGGAMHKVADWFPGLDIELVTWISQKCMYSDEESITADCHAIPKQLEGSVPLVQLSSDGFPRTQDAAADSGSDANAMGYPFLARHEIVLRRFQQSAQHLREHVLNQVCGNMQSSAPSLVLVLRDPVGNMHDRVITNPGDLVKSARIRAAAHGLKLVITTLENTTVRDECALFSGCKVLVLQHGAAGVNCMLMSPGSKVLEIAAPSRRPVKFWCSDILSIQHHRTLPTGRLQDESRTGGHRVWVDPKRFDQALRWVLDNRLVTGVGQGQHGVRSHLLELLRWMVASSQDRYNPLNRSDLDFDAICQQERTKATMAVSAPGRLEPLRLLVVSGQGGSSTRAISDALQALPSLSAGPVSAMGQDSAVVHLPNMVSDDALFGLAASSISNDPYPQKWPAGSLGGEISYMQQGVCDAVQAMLAWQKTCHPTATHALLKEPLLMYLMPLILRAPQTCEVMPYLEQVFIHVIRDPRIHHKPHKTIEAYEYMFSSEEKEAHKKRLQEQLSTDPYTEIPHAFGGGEDTRVWTALDIMKFAAAWQNRSIHVHNLWSRQGSQKYFLLRVDRVAPPRPQAAIRAVYQDLLATLGLPDPGPKIMHHMVTSYQEMGTPQTEPSLKLRLIEGFAGEALRIFGFLSA